MLICCWTSSGTGVCLGRGIPASSGTTLSPTRTTSTASGTDSKQRTGRSAVGAAHSGLLNQRRQHFHNLYYKLISTDSERIPLVFHSTFAQTSSTDEPSALFCPQSFAQCCPPVNCVVERASRISYLIIRGSLNTFVNSVISEIKLITGNISVSSN